MVEIRLENLRKTFGDVIATDQVNLTLRDGELSTLLGPSGCGKTTLLRLIAGFYTPDSGRIYFDDRDVTYIPPHRRNTGMCFQNYALWPHMSVYDNIAFGLRMKRINNMRYTRAAIDRRVKDVLALVHLEGLENRHIHQLSGGQQQRIALARALVIEPDVLLLDEPLSNLDAKLRLEMREEIIRIQKELSITTVYVTHDQTEALSISDMVAVMDKGYVQQFGPPREIYSTPQTLFVADFIGQCTFIRGKIVELGNHITVEIPNRQRVTGRPTIPKYPFAMNEEVVCAVRPEALNLQQMNKNDNEIMGVVKSVIYVGNSLEVHFEVGEVAAVARLPFDTKITQGDTIRFYASIEDMMILPTGGIDALRKVPDHPLFHASVVSLPTASNV